MSQSNLEISSTSVHVAERRESLSEKVLYLSTHLLLLARGGAELMAMTVTGAGAEGTATHQKPVSFACS